jgi:LuxR family maltose regulon positive regulatory protein
VEDQVSLPLLTTKLHVPSARPGLVPRTHLIERLNAGLHRKLTLISASAGFGKTTLAAAWLREAHRPHAWLSLDEGDNDPARFVAYLLAALRRVDQDIGQSAQVMLQAPQPPPPEALLTALINDIAATAQPLILVLDDYHVIHTLPIHQQLAFLLEHQPPQMHLVIATREDPPMALSRLRARGQMTEIRQAELEFSRAETIGFLECTMGLDLSAAHLAALHERTEGWIAGLQLVALSLQRSEDVDGLVQSFTSSHRYVLDYLIEEVFQQQPPDEREFLLRTSILERLTAPLCDAVAERKDSREMLLHLENTNLFLVPLDESRSWYRYHRLFDDLLRHRLRIEAADLVPTLHQRASQWYEAAGYLADAVHHALAGADWQRAATLIAALGDTMMKRGEVSTLLRWCGAVPDREMRTRPQLCLDYSWALILAGQLDAAESYLEPAQAYAQDAPALLGAIAVAQVHIARIRGDDRLTIELSKRALGLLPEDDYAARSVVAINQGIAHWNSGRLEEAERALREAERAGQRSGNHYARLVALGFLGVIQATWGKLHLAAERYEQAIHSGQQLPPVALAHNELAALLYEWNDLQAAEDHLQRGMELGRRSGNVEIQGGNYRISARLKQVQGDPAAALEALDRAHQLARDHDLSPLVRARDAACHVQIALCQGDLGTAIRWAEQVIEDADGSPFYPRLGLTRARLFLAQGRKAAAAELLQACSEKAMREGWKYGLITVRALQSLSAPTLDGALDILANALTLASPEGYVRTFVDLGEPMAALLREALSRDISVVYADRLLAAFVSSGLQLSSREQVGAAPTPPQRAAQRPRTLVEPLSERELEALRLLASGQTNREIAQTLSVSINTVKTHLKSIYGKLDVHSRRQAAALARELGLVP